MGGLESGRPGAGRVAKLALLVALAGCASAPDGPVHVLRPGENLYVVTVEGEDRAEAAIIAGASAEVVSQGPLWQSVLDFVFGLER